MISKNIGNAAGELSKLFGKREREYPQEKLQEEINEILIKNGVLESEQLSFVDCVRKRIGTKHCLNPNRAHSGISFGA